MIDFTPRPELQELREQVRAFVDAEIIPAEGAIWDENERGEYSTIELLQAKARAAGLWTPHLPVDLGGKDLGPMGMAVLFREMGRSFAGAKVFNCDAPDQGNMDLLAKVASDSARERWLKPLCDGEITSAFCMTEPAPGAGADPTNLRTTARREGDEWVIDGAKRWIGNATQADIVVIWAKDAESGRVLGFIVPTTTPGFSATRIERKISLRMVQNADIVLDGVRVPESLRLQGANSFRDTARVLRLTRAEVAWSAVGVMMGAYEAAVRYTTERVQFGSPIAGHQLVQDLLAKSLGHITASIALCVQVSRMLDEDRQEDAHSALAKAYATSRMREVVSWCREVCGGNGIVTDYEVARFFADAEALYTYEGTAQMNSLIVGRAITGQSAFA